jgi:hypothetical protein
MSNRLTITNPEVFHTLFRPTVYVDKYIWKSKTGHIVITLKRHPTPNGYYNGYYKLEITAPHINWSGFVNLPDKLTVFQSEVFDVLNLKDA